MLSLVDYSSDSEESLHDENECQVVKRLPLPGVLLNNLKREEVKDDPTENEGRIRAFPHVRGNWASHLFISYDMNEIEVLVEQLVSECWDCDVEIKAVTEPHLSLSRTFVLLYHWIPEFVSTVGSTLSTLQSFKVELGGMKVYVNDEGTRTFLGLTVSSGSHYLSQTVSLLDSCLSQYGLKPFYEDGSFHVSICWCLGDKSSYFKSIQHRLNPIVNEFLMDHSSSSLILASCVVAKIGNRIYNFKLVS